MEIGAITAKPLLAFNKNLSPVPPYFRNLLPFHQRRHHLFLISSTSIASRCGVRSAISFAAIILRPSSQHPVGIGRRAACISTTASAGSGAGGGGGDDALGGGGGGGGDGGGSSGETETKRIGVESEDAAVLGSDVIVLDVGGMSCGGCAASVKRILESQTQVSSARVNLATETAVVWAKPEAKVSQNWQHELGDALAGHLTTCGFKSSYRGLLDGEEDLDWSNL